jgi:exodeoxyribonuclease-1
MPFIYYDTETTGTNRDFDQILQFAAILTGDNLKEIDRFEIRCGLLPWIIPAPMALKVTGIHPDRLKDPSLPSFYEMMCSIKAKFDVWGQAIFIGYNSIKFDEPLLQRSFWQSLHPPYHTVTGGNARMDLYPLVQAAAHLTKDALAIPQNDKGAPSFKLDRLAPLNGFNHSNAHDALSDVEATIHIARLLAERSPELWSHAVRHCTKGACAQLAASPGPILVAEHFGSPSLWWGIRLDDAGPSASTATLARLDYDWATLRTEPAEELAKAVGAFPKPIRSLRLNQAPLLFSLQQAQSLWELFPSSGEAQTFNALASDQDFRARLLKAAEPDPWPEPQHLEQMMVGAFPSRQDEAVMRRFHKEDWPGKAALIREFEDDRLKRLAQRLVFAEAPGLLTQEDARRLHQAISERFHQDHKDAKLWRTIAAARRELEEVRSEKDGAAIATDIETWLQNLAALHPTSSNLSIRADDANSEREKG